MTTTPGERLRAAVVDLYDLTEPELALLDAAAATADLCAALAELVDRDGLLIAGQAGITKLHPAAAELRQQRLTLARLIVALRIPTDEEGEPTGAARIQRRGIRGVYGVGA